MDRLHVIVDTREQCPYVFDGNRVLATRKTLPAGDYSLDQLETVVAIERKTLDDFVTTVIHARDRFSRELEKLSTYRAACVVVEADLADLLRGRYRSTAHGNAVLGSALAIIVDHGIPVFFCSNRDMACQFVEGYLRRVWKMVEESQT